MLEPKQIHAVMLLAAGNTYTNVSNEVQIAQSTLLRWRKDPEFTQEIRNELNARLRDNLPAIYNALIEECLKGSAQHIRILFEHMRETDKLYQETHANEDTTVSWRN